MQTNLLGRFEHKRHRTIKGH